MVLSQKTNMGIQASSIQEQKNQINYKMMITQFDLLINILIKLEFRVCVTKKMKKRSFNC